jgi:cell division protein FtsB
MRSHHWIAISIVISTFVVGYCVLAPSALPKLWQMRRKESMHQTEIAALKKQALSLSQEAVLLAGDTQDSREYLEYVARKEHGFIGHDEVLLLLDTKNGRKPHHEKNFHP